MILGRSRGTLAVDIGSSQVKMAAMDPEAGRISALGIEPIPEDAIVGSEVMDYHLVVDVVRGLREKIDPRGRVVATAVSGRDVIVKRIKMDRMKEQEARQVIRWEAEQHVPFDMESVSLDFEILDPEADGLQMEVLLVAAKRDLVDTRLRLLKEAGLSPGIIDLDAFAVQTAFEHGYEHAPYSTVCMLNVGRETTNVNLVEAGRPILTRDLSTGQRRFVEALVRDLGISTQDAERQLREGELNPDARQAIEEPIDSLVTPVERARAFLSTNDTDAKGLDEVILSGGGAALPGVRDAIADRLQTEVTVLDPLKGIDLAPGLRPVVEASGGPAALAVVVGLGLRKE